MFFQPRTLTSKFTSGFALYPVSRVGTDISYLLGGFQPRPKAQSILINGSINVISGWASRIALMHPFLDDARRRLA